MELLPIALITAACVVVAYYIGKWVGEGNACAVFVQAYKRNKGAFCKALEQIIEENDL
jgi:uncharacterized protein (UPF0333 family)